MIVWDAKSGAVLQRLDTQHKKYISSLATSDDESLMATGFEDGLFNLWDISTGRLLHSKKNHEKSISAITILSDHSFLATGY